MYSVSVLSRDRVCESLFDRSSGSSFLFIFFRQIIDGGAPLKHADSTDTYLSSAQWRSLISHLLFRCRSSCMAPTFFLPSSLFVHKQYLKSIFVWPLHEDYCIKCFFFFIWRFWRHLANAADIACSHVVVTLDPHPHPQDVTSCNCGVFWCSSSRAPAIEQYCELCSYKRKKTMILGSFHLSKSPNVCLMQIYCFVWTR